MTALESDDLSRVADDISDADANLRRLVIRLNNLAARALAWAEEQEQERDRDADRN